MFASPVVMAQLMASIMIRTAGISLLPFHFSVLIV